MAFSANMPIAIGFKAALQASIVPSVPPNTDMLTIRKIMRISPIMPQPTLDDKGRPI